MIGRPSVSGTSGGTRVGILPRGPSEIAPRLGLAKEAWAVPQQAVARLAGGALVVGALAVMLGAGGRAAPRTSVLVAARRLAAGAELSLGDLRTAGVGGGNALLATLVPARAEVSVVGETLGGPLAAGEPLPRTLLEPRAPAALTLPVGVEQALGGTLVAGDRISVIATFTTAAGGAVARVLARGLLVLAVGQAPSIGDPSEETVPVTVALPDPELASRLALAAAVARLDLLRDGTPSQDGAIPSATAPGAVG